MTYIPIFTSECWKCGTSPTVGVCRPSGADDTKLCGPHFFANRAMVEWESWNDPIDSTD